MQFLKVGVAKSDITPPVGTKMDGYIRRKDVSQGIQDPLFAKALYLNDGHAQAALVVIDSLAVGQKLVRKARKQIEQETGLPSQHVSIAATHTHSGPSGLVVLSFGEGYDDDLLEFVASQITKAVKQAKEGAFEAILKVGSTVVEGITQDRSNPVQPIDQRLHVLRIEDTAGRLRAVLANYPCHPTFLGFDNLMISADWPGAVCSIIEKVVNDDVIVIMTNGASGDIHPMYLRQSVEDMKRMGQVLGGTIVTLLGHLRPVGKRLRTQNVRWSIEVETEPQYGRLVIDSRVQVFHRTASLPVKEFVSEGENDKEIKELGDELMTLGLDEDTLSLLTANPGSMAQSKVSLTSTQWAHIGDISTLLAPGDKTLHSIENNLAVSPERDISLALAQLSRKYDLLARLNMLAGERLERDGPLRKSGECQEQEIDLYLMSFDPDLAVLLIPGELSSRIGLSIKQRSGVRNLIIVTYANNYAGYIVPAEDYPKGGYEVGVSHFAAGAEVILTQVALDLIGEATSYAK